MGGRGLGLPQRIPVLILYGTDLVEENDEVRFLDDIYGCDKDSERALAGVGPHYHYHPTSGAPNRHRHGRIGIEHSIRHHHGAKPERQLAAGAC